ncbi:MAG TPA: LacI family DNA-binding transcriptional regulator, partial [Devosia sp.]|nr:LacI family DNA-binding transcriptional regulator [Devosia sp.]
MARVTVQGIADQLGISKFAVSRALSGHAGVSPATRAAVVELAARLGYVPRNRPASDINIEIIYHDAETMQRELWVDVQAGAQLEGAKHGIGTAVRWTGDPRLVAGLASGANGILLVGPHDDAIVAAIRQAKIPCVRIGGELPPLEPMDKVDRVDGEGAAIVAQYLLELGHQRFVYVHGKLGYPGQMTRFESFAETLAEA